ncbi:MAG: hypothetical protein ACR2FM_01970 [Candidatus Saccharimonadales bacterium]
MAADQNYLQQTTDPLFPNLLWSRPETKHGAGKLLIIGGQAQEFIHVAESFMQADQAGAGTIRVLMPDSTRKLTKMLPNIEYAPANASGSFAKTALAELLSASQWADTVLLAGDIGKNSETNLMLESFMTTYTGPLVIASLAMQSVTMPLADLFLRDSTSLIVTRSELQKIGIELKLEKAVTSTVNNSELAAILHKLTTDYALNLVVADDSQTWNAYRGQVALTNNAAAYTAAQVAVWTMQNPAKLFEATTTAVYC